MKHASTRTLFDYWNRRRGRRLALARSDIDPGDIRTVLGDTFLLAADFVDEIRFRLAGTRICALFARELKGDAFNSLWNEASREHIDALLHSVIHENEVIVAGAFGRTEDDDGIDLELLVLPLASDGGNRVRALGVLAPLVPAHALGDRPLIELDLRTFRHIGAEQLLNTGPRFGQPHDEPRARHGFLVYSGGLDLQPDKRPS
jgi:hypothetical protein